MSFYFHFVQKAILKKNKKIKNKIKSRRGESVDCMKKKKRRYFMEKLKVKKDTWEAGRIREERLFLWDEKKKSEKKKGWKREKVRFLKRSTWERGKGGFSRVNGGFSKRWYKRGKDQKGEEEIERKKERSETTSQQRFSC